MSDSAAGNGEPITDEARHRTPSCRLSFTFARDLARYTVNQKKYPRLIWVRRASLYHSSRLRLNTFYRSRSTLDDQLIKDIAELTMSQYVSVRKSAQRALDSITSIYDGTRKMTMDSFFEALKREFQTACAGIPHAD